MLIIFIWTSQCMRQTSPLRPWWIWDALIAHVLWVNDIAMGLFMSTRRHSINQKHNLKHTILLLCTGNYMAFPTHTHRKQVIKPFWKGPHNLGQLTGRLPSFPSVSTSTSKVVTSSILTMLSSSQFTQAWHCTSILHRWRCNWDVDF